MVCELSREKEKTNVCGIFLKYHFLTTKIICIFVFNFEAAFPLKTTNKIWVIKPFKTRETTACQCLVYFKLQYLLCTLTSKVFTEPWAFLMEVRQNILIAR